MNRGKYLATETAAGFQEIEVVREISFKGLYNRGTVHELIASSGVSPDVVREAEEAIAGMQIKAIKPS